MSKELKTEAKKEVVDMENLWKKGKGFDLDFDKIEMVRGATPKDIEEKCLNYCKDYLSGNWCQQTIDTVQVRRVTGGLLNQLYYIGICKPDNNTDIPQEVAIKFYGDFRPNFNSDEEDNNSRMKDQIISLVFSERNLGPKIYGIFENGQIQKFYKQRPYSLEEKKDPQLFEKVSRTLARIHSMELPVKKSTKQIEILEKSYEEGFEKFIKVAEEYNCETLLKNDLKVEIDWFKGVIERLNSPIVFCHSDYRSSNLLITEPNDELVVCDFDLSGYNYRGSDFSFMMREWTLKHFIQSMKSIEGLPTESELRPFIEIYVDECEKINGKSFTENENNSVDHILKEAKIFLLFTYLFFTALHLRGRKDQEGKDERDENGNLPDPKPGMEMLEMNYKNYFKVKRILEEQNIFD